MLPASPPFGLPRRLAGLLAVAALVAAVAAWGSVGAWAAERQAAGSATKHSAKKAKKTTAKARKKASAKVKAKTKAKSKAKAKAKSRTETNAGTPGVAPATTVAAPLVAPDLTAPSAPTQTAIAAPPATPVAPTEEPARQVPTSSAIPFPAGVSPSSAYEDDFSGAALDPVWKLYNSVGHAGNGLRRSSAITVDGAGHLVITASMSDGVVVSGGMARRTDQTYGRYEFRVRTDVDPSGTTSGVVLTWPQSENWPTDGESDMYETGTTTSRNRFNSAIHYGASNKQVVFRSNVDATQWHTVVMDWTPTSISLYRDGVLIGGTTDPAAIPHVAQHLCLQLDAMNGGKLAQPVRMMVDYVKVWDFS